MKIISYNIRYGGLGRENKIIEVLKAADPDVIILIEATHPQVVQLVQEKLNFPFSDSIQSSSVAFLSKIEPVSYQWHDKQGLHAPFLELVFEHFSIFGIHLTALLASWREKQRAHEVELLLEVINVSGRSNNLLIGDFNAIAIGDSANVSRMPLWLRGLIRLNGGIHSFALKNLIDASYVDVFRYLHPYDNGYTLPPPNPNSRLDYAFASSPLIDYIESCYVVKHPEIVDRASDHYPIVVEIDL